MIGDIPELRELRRELRWRGVAPEALSPQRGGAGHQGVFKHIDGRAELLPHNGAERRLHRLFSHNVSSFFFFSHNVAQKAVRRCPNIEGSAKNPGLFENRLIGLWSPFGIEGQEKRTPTKKLVGVLFSCYALIVTKDRPGDLKAFSSCKGVSTSNLSPHGD